MLAHLPLILLAQTAVEPQVPPAVSPAPTDQSEGRLGTAQQGGGDIVVTARRRVETIQSVPIAISVIGGTALAETGTYNVNRLTQLQPSLQFYSTNPRNSAANIRGLGAPFGLTNDGIEQGVGIYVDQVYYSRIASATFDFTDTERIEVLRGPQGTLYGKNTTAGAINISTRKPSFTPEARVEVTGGNYDFFQGKASVSGPLIDDKLAIRLSTSITTRRGTIYNTRLNDYQNSQDNKSFRGQLLWKPTDTLDLTLYGDYNAQDPKCCVQYYVRTGATQRPVARQYAALAAAFGYAAPSTNAFDRVTDLDAVPRAKQKIGGTSLVGNLDLGGATLTSVSAYRFWDWVPNSDRDFTGLPITTVSANTSQQYQLSQELRVASNGTHKIDYLAGLFYFYQAVDVEGLQVQGSAASRYLLSGANASNPAVLNGLTSTLRSHLGNTSAALFGKLTWHVSDRFSIAPGARLNYDKKDAQYDAVVTTGAGTVIRCTPAPTAAVLRDQCTTLPPQSYPAHLSKWNLSGDVTAAWTISRDLHAYATYARSYKSGGVNLSGLPLDAANQPLYSASTVKPEAVNHYELGLKTQFLDRRATVNLAAFWTDIFDYQASVNNGQLGVLRGYLANAGHVRTRGIEIDSAFRPTARFNVYANGAYTDAKYARFVDAPCPPELSGGTTATAGQVPSAPGTPGGISPASCNISGQVLPGVSKWAFSYGAEYDVPTQIGRVSGQFYLGYDGSYRSRFSSNPSASAYTNIDGYALSNFRLGFKAKDDFNVFGWVRNAFDQNYYEVLTTQSGNTGLVIGQPGDPRTYGVTVSKSF
ncbi:TonB-dependent receptor [Sphingomonas sp. TREG-RG-20F-R18-01]|uniref:TonB-dependent receptor n=1 Tax=Sphingomonas sp. TREG-RG-20F-R18-01 TaxID=2914982 RepID=UPI001F5AD5BD|nr:TonB-dependent receptor [Sphingomonas sp. TREG-RG-20F-R18-01]